MRVKILKFHNEPRVFWTLVATIVICVVFYVYSINRAVYNVIERQNLEIKVSSLRSTVGTLESRYITLRGKINIETARSLGFKESPSSDFVRRSSLGKNLALTNEI